MEYAYRVGERDYRCSRIQWGGLIDLPSRSAAASVVGHYKTGKPVKVYYNPRQPAVAVLQPGHAAGIGNIVFIAPFFVLFGLFYSASRFSADFNRPRPLAPQLLHIAAQFFHRSRLWRDERVGVVAFRNVGRMAASRIMSTSRSSASLRL